MKSVLNVGGNSKDIPIPAYFEGWKHDLLDIDPSTSADIICDGRELNKLDKSLYDAVYCSHNLEHYHPHEIIKVLNGFYHVLKDDGFIDIRVPDIMSVIEHIVENNMELDDELYMSAAGPITAHDVIYGYGKEIEQSGNDFFAHKRGFTPYTLEKSIKDSGFPEVIILKIPQAFEVIAYAFKHKPTKELLEQIGFRVI